MDWPKLLRIEDVSEVTGVPVATLRSMRARGQGPHGFKLGGRVVFKEDDVRSWINEQYAKSVAS